MVEQIRDMHQRRRMEDGLEGGRGTTVKSIGLDQDETGSGWSSQVNQVDASAHWCRKICTIFLWRPLNGRRFCELVQHPPAFIFLRFFRRARTDRVVQSAFGRILTPKEALNPGDMLKMKPSTASKPRSPAWGRVQSRCAVWRRCRSDRESARDHRFASRGVESVGMGRPAACQSPT